MEKLWLQPILSGVISLLITSRGSPCRVKASEIYWDFGGYRDCICLRYTWYESWNLENFHRRNRFKSTWTWITNDFVGYLFDVSFKLKMFLVKNIVYLYTRVLQLESTRAFPKSVIIFYALLLGDFGCYWTLRACTGIVEPKRCAWKIWYVKNRDEGFNDFDGEPYSKTLNREPCFQSALISSAGISLTTGHNGATQPTRSTPKTRTLGKEKLNLEGLKVPPNIQ